MHSPKSWINILFVGLLLAGCQERSGPCPDISGVDPAREYPGDLVTVTGSGFALGHSDLWDDNAGVPPEFFLDVSLLDSIPESMQELMSPDELADLAMMEMVLTAGSVEFISPEQLDVSLPNISWNDLVSAAELYGGEVPEMPAGMELPLVSTVRVVNASGCEGTWDESFELILVIDGEE